MSIHILFAWPSNTTFLNTFINNLNYSSLSQTSMFDFKFLGFHLKPMTDQLLYFLFGYVWMRL